MIYVWWRYLSTSQRKPSAFRNIYSLPSMHPGADETNLNEPKPVSRDATPE